MATISSMVGALSPAFGTPPSTYFSSGQYRDFTCPQLAQEAQKVSARVMVLSGERPTSSHPAVVADDENVVAWPSALDDSGKQASGEIAAAKEQMLAIEDASIQSQCDIEFVRSAH
jgi:hypothetical protein